ncbi:YdbL family protein [Sphingomonas profundi]|uniref:YdbL family protein n=1 Tax=Alterirhizorhabdus profundi TaxID=2681549 RepID=UPI0012E97853|nr:YdbL family protein [Sphingomonas profundi]
MTRTRTFIALFVGAALVAGAAGIAYAQDADLQGAIAQGIVGEKADGYLGLAKAASPEIKAKVDAINIKRRAAFTPEAAKRGVTLEEWAAAIGCKTLAGRVANGQAYLLPDGVWRVKSGPIALPGSCG